MAAHAAGEAPTVQQPAHINHLSTHRQPQEADTAVSAACILSEGVEKGNALIHLHLLCAGLLCRDLSINTLHGPIPEALWQLTQLETLDLENNQLTSTISPSIGNLKKLSTL